MVVNNLRDGEGARGQAGYKQDRHRVAWLMLCELTVHLGDDVMLETHSEEMMARRERKLAGFAGREMSGQLKSLCVSFDVA